MSRYGFWGFKPQPTVLERKEKAAKTIARLRKKGALVIGSGRSPYEVVIRIDKMNKPDWDALVKRSSGGRRHGQDEVAEEAQKEARARCRAGCRGTHSSRCALKAK